MNFKESLDYLYGLGYERSVKKFGLENSIALLKALGYPQNRFLKVQVAGTNGKGSTCAFLEAICVAAGIKVGLNTSPHLVSVTERIRINGEDISEDRFAEYVTKVRAAGENLVETGGLEAIPTFFEHITAIAQLAFADEGVEVAILETGLGGRFDATTATLAEIVAITPIDLDHTKTLGDTIELIASEKAAIIREGVCAVIADQSEAAMRVILDKCAAENVKPDFAADVLAIPTGDSVTFETAGDRYRTAGLSLKGTHQIENAKSAILLAETLAAKGFLISPDDVRKGLETARHSGRLEFSDGILFDGAHNTAGARVLREFLLNSVDQPITMIFAAMNGKNIGEISELLFPLAENLILTTPENPRAMNAREIAEFIPGDKKNV
ncbi:MAG: bifunctional folylpolyglutamate synthase/dihydrofolate synthase, partial [Acidobacteria bacterium]|nr:bifunctional folylpolyglutamate synthase/dihydrofolate synthase [Acidobacteriota bacterium]